MLFNVHFNALFIREPCLPRGERKSNTRKQARRYRSQTNSQTASSSVSKKDLRSSSLEHLLVGWCAEQSSGDFVKMLQIPSFSTAFVEHPGVLCQMTHHVNPENHESNY